jgi:sarcosine oxidase subunit delta
MEFAYGGEVRVSPDPDTCTDAEWSAYVFNRSGSPGVKYEWWCHIASGYWFIALRDTARDIVVATYPAETARRGLPAHDANAGAQAAGTRAQDQAS